MGPWTWPPTAPRKVRRPRCCPLHENWQPTRGRPMKPAVTDVTVPPAAALRYQYATRERDRMIADQMDRMIRPAGASTAVEAQRVVSHACQDRVGSNCQVSALGRLHWT